MALTTEPSPAEVLEKLRKSESLKLLALAETLSPKDTPQTEKRNSAVSDDSEQNADTHPAALEADLAHYKVTKTCKSNFQVKLTFLAGTI